MAKGLDSFFRKDDTKKQEQGQKYQRNLYLKNDGDMARIRFLTESEDIEPVFVHQIEYSSNGRKMYSERSCTGRNNGCKYCADGLKVTNKWNAWVYVYETYSMVPSKGSEAMQSPDGKTTAYITKVNQVMLLRNGRGKDDYIITKLKNLRQKYGTLLDRDYDYSMNKTANGRSYDFLPNEPTQFSVRAELPYSLEDAAKAYPYVPEIKSAPPVPAPATDPGVIVREGGNAKVEEVLTSRQLYRKLFSKKESK